MRLFFAVKLFAHLGQLHFCNYVHLALHITRTEAPKT